MPYDRGMNPLLMVVGVLVLLGIVGFMFWYFSDPSEVDTEEEERVNEGEMSALGKDEFKLDPNQNPNEAYGGE